MNIDKDKVKKILIFKLCCLGDIVMLTPVINTLKENFPDAQITLIVCSWVEGITGYLKNVDSVIINDDLYKKKLFDKLKGVKNIITVLREHSFDLAFLGHRNNVFGLILKLSRIKIRLGFSNTKFINYGEPFDDKQHEVYRYLSILNSIGIEPKVSQLELKQKIKRDEIKNKFNIEDGKFIIGIFPFGGINPGTGMNIKRWELKKYFELIEKVKIDYPDALIILFEGSEKDEKIKETERSKIVIKREINFNLISICNIIISGDTGAMHIAAGFNVSTLSIFGPTDPQLLAPLNTQADLKVIHRYIWKRPECSPCYTPETAMDKKNSKYWKDGYFFCNTGTHICMKEISVAEVFINFSEMIKTIRE
jgi:ADP-heptose:LPS heptosyltransferase